MNKKGFTLIELIVVIAIMGVILILALPQISSIQRANRDRKYEAYKESLVSASKLYVDNHARDMFGYNDSGCAIIKYSDLKGSDLIKDFASIDVTCSRDTDTFVEVRKVGNNYKYAGSLVCRSKDGQIVKSIKDDLEGSSCINEPDENGPIITSNPSSHNWVQTKNLKVNIIVSDVSGLNRNIGIQYHWVNLDNGSTSQTYTYSYNNKKDVDKVSFRIPTKNIPTVTGNYRLIIEPWKTPNTNGVQDVLGNITYSGVSKEIYRIDNTNPTCGTVTGSKTYWTNQNFTISQACNDSHSGCVKNIYDQYFSSTTKTFTFTISDNAGNTTTCGVNVYLDKDYPTCGTVTGASTSWTASNRNITVQCNDKSTGSGCTQPSFQKTFSSTTKVGKISISDIAGNVTQCNVNAYVDKTAPTCGTVTGASTSWTNKSRTISVQCNDKDSGCGSFSNTYSSTTKTSNIQIRDKAGNTRNCPVNVYVDTTPPSCTSSGGTSSFVWGPVTIKGTCSDSDSGCVANVSKTFDDAYLDTSVSPGTVRDYAGNEKVCPNQTVKLNKTPDKPSIYNPSYGHWRNYSITLSISTTTPSNRIDHWEYRYDDGAWQIVPNYKTSSLAYNAQDEQNRKYSIRVCAKGGICSEAASTYLKIDKTAPTIKGVGLYGFNQYNSSGGKSSIARMDSVDCGATNDTCTGRICLENIPGSMDVPLPDYRCYDDMSGCTSYIYDRGQSVYNRNGNLVSGCHWTNNDNPCRLEAYIRVSDLAGNIGRFNYTLTVGYIWKTGDGSGC